MKKDEGKVLLETRGFFERVAEEYSSTSKEGDELKLGLLKELAQAGDSLLDIGCGNGYFADSTLAETNISCACGLDISSAMLSLNKRLPNKCLCLASALQLPFRPRSFTFVHFDAVLHHVVGTSRKSSVQNARDVIQSCVALTKKDGYLVLTERCVNSRISSTIIFYALKFLSRTILAKPFKISSGLMVSFLTPEEFLSGIRATGARIIRTEVRHPGVPFLFRLALCKSHPRIHVVVSP